MSKKYIIFFLLIVLGFYSPSDAVLVTITKSEQDLQADVSGMFMFSGATFFWYYGFTQFPVPPNASNIEITESGPVFWSWGEDEYETLYLPEEPNWPMIEWELVWFPGPVAPITITYCIDYEHTLIKRDGRFIFFYANESFEYNSGPGYPSGLFSATYFTIDFPEEYVVKGVWSRDIPLEYQVNGNRISFSAEHLDRISVILGELCEYVLAGDLNNDCVANFKDFAILANSWLIDCIEEPNNPGCIPKQYP